jgi:hypothetical protein
MIDNSYFITFAMGAGAGIWFSWWVTQQLNSFRSPRYYRRRARRVARGQW